MIRRLLVVWVIALSVVTLPVLASDLGVRSIKVVIANMTQANFTIDSSTALTGKWVEGMEPVQGANLSNYQAMSFGVYTNVFTQGVSGQLVLAGYGDPLVIGFSNNAQGQVQYSVEGGNVEVRIESHLVSTGAQNRGVISMTITPAVVNRPASY